jgi:hypothetical protein
MLLPEVLKGKKSTLPRSTPMPNCTPTCAAMTTATCPNTIDMPMPRSKPHCPSPIPLARMASQTSRSAPDTPRSSPDIRMYWWTTPPHSNSRRRSRPMQRMGDSLEPITHVFVPVTQNSVQGRTNGRSEDTPQSFPIDMTRRRTAPDAFPLSPPPIWRCIASKRPHDQTQIYEPKPKNAGDDYSWSEGVFLGDGRRRVGRPGCPHERKDGDAEEEQGVGEEYCWEG